MGTFTEFNSQISSQFSNFEKFKSHVENVLANRKQRRVEVTQLSQNSKDAGVLFSLLISKSLLKYKLKPHELITDLIYLVLEKRSKSMKNHPGDLAFPGGTREKNDKDIVATAYREAEEELGISSDNLIFISKMDEFVSSSEIIVKPIVSWLYVNTLVDNVINFARTEFKPTSEESESSVIVPLSHFMKPEFYSSRPYLKKGKKIGFVRFFSIDPYLKNEYVWGLTATMIRRFINLIFPNNNLPKEQL